MKLPRCESLLSTATKFALSPSQERTQAEWCSSRRSSCGESAPRRFFSACLHLLIDDDLLDTTLSFCFLSSLHAFRELRDGSGSRDAQITARQFSASRDREIQVASTSLRPRKAALQISFLRLRDYTLLVLEYKMVATDHDLSSADMDAIP